MDGPLRLSPHGRGRLIKRCLIWAGGAVYRQALLSARRGGLYLRMFKINYFQFSFTVIGREEDANAKQVSYDP